MADVKNSGNLMWSIYEVFYDEAGVKNIQAFPKRYFSEKLEGATIHTHIRVEYEGKEILAKDEDKVVKDPYSPVYASTKAKNTPIPIGSLVTCWAEVEGHPEYSTDYAPFKSSTYAKSTLIQTHVYAISDKDVKTYEFTLHDTKRSPKSMKVTVQGVAVPFRNGSIDHSLDRRFEAGKIIRVAAEASGYKPKVLHIEMPDHDYVLDEITLSAE